MSRAETMRGLAHRNVDKCNICRVVIVEPVQEQVVHRAINERRFKMDLTDFLSKIGFSIGGTCQVCDTKHEDLFDGLHPLSQSSRLSPGILVCRGCLAKIAELVVGSKARCCTIEEAVQCIRSKPKF